MKFLILILLTTFGTREVDASLIPVPNPPVFSSEMRRALPKYSPVLVYGELLLVYTSFNEIQCQLVDQDGRFAWGEVGHSLKVDYYVAVVRYEFAAGEKTVVIEIQDPLRGSSRDVDVEMSLLDRNRQIIAGAGTTMKGDNSYSDIAWFDVDMGADAEGQKKSLRLICSDTVLPVRH